jgi:hypothetical protein
LFSINIKSSPVFIWIFLWNSLRSFTLVYTSVTNFSSSKRFSINSFTFQFNEEHQIVHFVYVGQAYTAAGVPLARMRRKWIKNLSRSYEQHVTAADGDITEDVKTILG